MIITIVPANNIYITECPQLSCVRGIILVWQMGKWSLWEMKWAALAHVASKWQCEDSNLCQSPLISVTLWTLLSLTCQLFAPVLSRYSMKICTIDWDNFFLPFKCIKDLPSTPSSSICPLQRQQCAQVSYSAGQANLPLAIVTVISRFGIPHHLPLTSSSLPGQI